MYRYLSNASCVTAWRWTFVLAALLLMGSVRADELTPLTWPADSAGHIDMSGRFAVLVDGARALNPDAVVAGHHDAEIIPATRRNTNFGFTHTEF